jgi:hypothetical protein
VFKGKFEFSFDLALVIGIVSLIIGVIGLFK